MVLKSRKVPDYRGPLRTSVPIPAALRDRSAMSDDFLRVTHVVLSMDCGGLESVVLGLVRGSRRLGQRVAVACLERTGKLAAQADALGARVVCIYKRPGLRLGIIGRLESLLRELGPDVVHTHHIGA